MKTLCKNSKIKFAKNLLKNCEKIVERIMDKTFKIIVQKIVQICEKKIENLWGGDGYIVENVYEPLDAPGYHAAVRRRED